MFILGPHEAPSSWWGSASSAKDQLKIRCPLCLQESKVTLIEKREKSEALKDIIRYKLGKQCQSNL